MSFEQSYSTPIWLDTPSSTDSAFNRGLEYLRAVQRLALEPEMVDVLDNLRDRITICSWIGENIHNVNARLNCCLQACHECFRPHERCHIQIFAAPLAQPFYLDGLCNIQIQPITILIDVGRAHPDDWLAIVAHEYAHAHLGNAGHHVLFATVLSHLCLGLGLEPPHWEYGIEAQLRHWPPYVPNSDPLAFWRGQS